MPISQMGQQLMLIIKLLSDSNERLKAENETLKSDVQRIRSGLAVLINSKQDLLSTKSNNDAIDNEPVEHSPFGHQSQRCH
jgi:hypothetical protein